MIETAAPLIDNDSLGDHGAFANTAKLLDTRMLHARIVRGNATRAKFFEHIRNTIMAKIRETSVQQMLRGLQNIIDLDCLEERANAAKLELSQECYEAQEEPSLALHAGVDIAKNDIMLRDRLTQVESEEEARAITALIRISERAKSALIQLFAIVTSDPQEYALFQTRTKLMQLGEDAYAVLRQSPDMQLAPLLDAPMQQSHPAMTQRPVPFTQTILMTEEKLANQQEHLQRESAQLTDALQGVSLLRRLAENLRRNVNVFNNAVGLQLHISQLHALKSLATFLERKGSKESKGYFRQSTGAGKTVLFGVITRLMDVQTVILVPRSNLLTQTRDELVKSVGISGHSIGPIGDDFNECGRKITIVTYKSHVSRMRNDDLYRTHIQHCQLVICDEAHRSLGKCALESLNALDDEWSDEPSEDEESTEDEVLANIEQYTAQHSLRLGFTATPRLRNKSVAKAFGELIAESDYSELVQAGVIKKFKVRQVDVQVKPGEIEQRISQTKEAELLEREDVYRRLLLAYKEARREMEEKLNGFATCSSIAECDKFTTIATGLGLRCSIVTGREFRAQRGVDHIGIAEQLLLSNKIDLIVTVDKLKEGWNFRPLNGVILARATLSPANILQPAGRASRAWPGQKFAYIFEPRWQFALSIGIKKDTLPVESAPIVEQGDQDPVCSNAGTGGDARHKGRRMKPISLVDALYLSGEQNVEKICEGWNGEQLKASVLPHLQNGQIEIDGEICVSLSHYGTGHKLDVETLYRKVKEANLIPKGHAISSTLVVRIYTKKDVESLSYVKDHLMLARISGTTREVRIDDHLCIGLDSFRHRFDPGIHRDLLMEEIEAAKILPTGRAKIGGWSIHVYRLDVLMNLPCVQRRQTLPAFKKGTNDIGIAGKRCASVHTYCASKKTEGIWYVQLQKAIKHAKLQPVGSALGKNSMKVDVYEIDQLEQLPYVRERLAKPNHETFPFVS